MNSTPDVDAPTGDYVSGNVEFGLALADRLVADAPQENLCFSPYGIGVALAMTYAGARGTTREEIAETMRFRPTGEALHRSLAALRSDLPLADASTATETPEQTATGDGSGVPFRLFGANGIWGQRGLHYRDPYLETLRRYYGAGPGQVDFAEAPGAARQGINDWVAERTKGDVPELFSEGEITSSTQLLVTSATGFRAHWTTAFLEEMTESREFTALNGSTTDVAMMVREDRLPFASAGDVDVVVLPFAGGHTDMLVMVPPVGQFREFERSLDTDRLEGLLDTSFSRRRVTVTMPRFELRSNVDLAGRLAAMGATSAFEPVADLGGVTDGLEDTDRPEGLHLDSVRHESALQVDERGAGVTADIESGQFSYASNQEFRADRPFLFVIRHRPTGAPLFLGRVVDAAAAQSDGGWLP